MVRVMMSQDTDTREAEQRSSAKEHQDQLELVESPPLEVTLPVQHQFISNAHCSPLQQAAGSGRRPPLPF